MLFAISEAAWNVIGIVAVAVIGGPIMWFLVRLEKRNSQQHDDNASKLDTAADAADLARKTAEDTNDIVRSLVERFDRHLEWHAHRKIDNDEVRNPSVPVPYRFGDTAPFDRRWPNF